MTQKHFIKFSSVQFWSNLNPFNFLIKHVKNYSPVKFHQHKYSIEMFYDVSAAVGKPHGHFELILSLSVGLIKLGTAAETAPPRSLICCGLRQEPVYCTGFCWQADLITMFLMSNTKEKIKAKGFLWVFFFSCCESQKTFSNATEIELIHCSLIHCKILRPNHMVIINRRNVSITFWHVWQWTEPRKS